MCCLFVVYLLCMWCVLLICVYSSGFYLLICSRCWDAGVEVVSELFVACVFSVYLLFMFFYLCSESLLYTDVACVFFVCVFLLFEIFQAKHFLWLNSCDNSSPILRRLAPLICQPATGRLSMCLAHSLPLGQWPWPHPILNGKRGGRMRWRGLARH